MSKSTWRPSLSLNSKNAQKTMDMAEPSRGGVAALKGAARGGDNWSLLAGQPRQMTGLDKVPNSEKPCFRELCKQQEESVQHHPVTSLDVCTLWLS